jgi:hypothetical protein
VHFTFGPGGKRGIFGRLVKTRDLPKTSEENSDAETSAAHICTPAAVRRRKNLHAKKAMANIAEPTKDLSSQPIPLLERLVVNEAEARALLGGISRTTLWRAEKSGHIRSVQGFGCKRYAVSELRRFVSGGAK